MRTTGSELRSRIVDCIGVLANMIIQFSSEAPTLI
jgi:hypothetical protein